MTSVLILLKVTRMKSTYSQTKVQYDAKIFSSCHNSNHVKACSCDKVAAITSKYDVLSSMLFFL